MNHFGQHNTNSKTRKANLHSDNHSYKRVALTLIYERDAGRCGVCRRHVAIDEATIDHIIPRSQGGTEIASNLQLAHLSCNSSRGAGKRPAQLRIIETKANYNTRESIS